MKIVYVAGPFRASTAWGIAENVRAAERIGLLVAYSGAMPLIPHANTAHFHGQCSDQYWVDGTLELLRRCDAAVFLPRWHLSTGSCGEMREVARLHMPFLDLGSISEAYHRTEIYDFIKRISHGQDDQPEEPGKAAQTVANGARNAP